MKLNVGVTGDLVGLRGDQELWRRVMRDESSVHAGRLRAVHFVTGESRERSPRQWTIRSEPWKQLGRRTRIRQAIMPSKQAAETNG